jgi:hypothetical protein
MLLVILFAELIALYYISRVLTTTLFRFFLLLFRVRSVAISILLVLEFPGTVTHELSHLFTAGILGVKAGKLRLDPPATQAELGEALRAGPDQNTTITTGSVAIAETDPFRRFAIGLAPVFGGLIILTTIAYFLPQIQTSWGIVGLGYLMFAVSNAMFSSPQDLKGFLPFAITLGIFVGLFYYLGLRIALTGAVLEVVTRITMTLENSLGIVLAVNVLLWGFTSLLITLLTRVFRVRVS